MAVATSGAEVLVDLSDTGTQSVENGDTSPIPVEAGTVEASSESVVPDTREIVLLDARDECSDAIAVGFLAIKAMNVRLGRIIQKAIRRLYHVLATDGASAEEQADVSDVEIRDYAYTQALIKNCRKIVMDYLKEEVVGFPKSGSAQGQLVSGAEFAYYFPRAEGADSDGLFLGWAGCFKLSTGIIEFGSQFPFGWIAEGVIETEVDSLIYDCMSGAVEIGSDEFKLRRDYDCHQGRTRPEPPPKKVEPKKVEGTGTDTSGNGDTSPKTGDDSEATASEATVKLPGKKVVEQSGSNLHKVLEDVEVLWADGKVDEAMVLLNEVCEVVADVSDAANELLRKMTGNDDK